MSELREVRHLSRCTQLGARVQQAQASAIAIRPLPQRPHVRMECDTCSFTKIEDAQHMLKTHVGKNAPLTSRSVIRKARSLKALLPMERMGARLVALYSLHTMIRSLVAQIRAGIAPHLG